MQVRTLEFTKFTVLDGRKITVRTYKTFAYAGHYVPQLAKEIVTYNKAQTSHPIINLKGFIVS